MRQITSEIQSAFNAKISRSIGNTRTDGTSVWLHNNRILYRDRCGRIWFSLAGWPTPTTRERLKIGGIDVHQSKHVQYCGDQEIDEHRWYRFREVDNRLISADSFEEIEPSEIVRFDSETR